MSMPSSQPSRHAMAGLLPANVATVAAFEADGYYEAGNAEHYQASLWHGRGAGAIGLTGPVEVHSFDAVMTGNWSIKMAFPAFMITLTAPTSVSVVTIIGGDTRMLAIHDKAVSDTLNYIEDNLFKARMLNLATKERMSGNDAMVAAIFRHNTSPCLNPVLHSHITIANMVCADDGILRAFEDASLVSESIELIGSIYANALAAGVMRLGYETEKTDRGTLFEIKGLYTSEQLDAFEPQPDQREL